VAEALRKLEGKGRAGGIQGHDEEVGTLELALSQEQGQALHAAGKAYAGNVWAAELLDEILSQPKISDSNLRMLVQKVLVHQNEDKSLDVQFILNGAFEQSVTKFDDEQ
jgi:hypothetical protein